MYLYKFIQQQVMTHYVVAPNLEQAYEILFTTLVVSCGEEYEDLTNQEFVDKRLACSLDVVLPCGLVFTVEQIVRATDSSRYLFCTGVTNTEPSQQRRNHDTT